MKNKGQDQAQDKLQLAVRYIMKNKGQGPG